MIKSIRKSNTLYNPKIVKKTRWDILPNIFLFLAGLFCFTFIMINFFTYSYFIVKNSSMSPTLNTNPNGINDAVYVNRFAKIEVGDIIVIRNEQTSYSVIKRVIGLGGDKIGFITKVEDGEIIRKLVRIPKGLQTYYEINEDYLENPMVNEYAFEKFQNLVSKEDNVEIVKGIAFYVVGDNEIFYVGDNRTASFDCFNYGSVSENLLIGRVDVIIKEQKFFIVQYFLYLFGIKKI